MKDILKIVLGLAVILILDHIIFHPCTDVLNPRCVGNGVSIHDRDQYILSSLKKS